VQPAKKLFHLLSQLQVSKGSFSMGSGSGKMRRRLETLVLAGSGIDAAGSTTRGSSCPIARIVGPIWELARRAGTSGKLTGCMLPWRASAWIASAL
jgi:hypothetical protein